MVISSIAKDSVGVLAAAVGGNGLVGSTYWKDEHGCKDGPQAPVPGAVMEAALLKKMRAILD